MIKTSEFGPWALVTGASSGIGREAASQLARAGFHLVLASRSSTALRELGESLSAAHGIQFRVVEIDLAVPQASRSLDEQTTDLDIGLVFSNAGESRPRRFLDVSLDELHTAVTLNGMSHVDMAHFFAPRLARRGRGGIVLVSALGGVHGIPHMAIASGAKALVRNLGEALHHELAPAGVKVLTIMPGAVDTPIIDKLGFDRENLPMRPQPVAEAIDETFRALERGRMTLIPSLKLRAMMAILPRSLSIKMNGRMLGAAAARLEALAGDANAPADEGSSDHAMTVELSPAMLRAGRVPARLLDWGVPLGGLMLLLTTGRHSGRERTVPIAVLRHEGQQWLVSPFGDVAWVLNLRAGGATALRRGRRRTAITATEITDERKTAVLKKYRASYRAVPFVRAAFTATPASALGDFAHEADRHPVFLVS